MHRLTIGDGDIARVADEGYGVRKTVRPKFIGHRTDIKFSHFDGIQYHPKPVLGVTAIELQHGVKPMSAFIEFGAVPVRPSVLMP